MLTCVPSVTCICSEQEYDFDTSIDCDAKFMIDREHGEQSSYSMLAPVEAGVNIPNTRRQHPFLARRIPHRVLTYRKAIHLLPSVYKFREIWFLCHLYLQLITFSETPQPISYSQHAFHHLTRHSSSILPPRGPHKEHFIPAYKPAIQSTRE